VTTVRAILGFAIATVLSGVPSSAFGAGNELSAADASPRSGTTLTPFTLSVQYHGGFPAVTVTADAGGRAFPMLPTSGNLLDGRWSVTALLPAGTWTVRFVAEASQGNDPRLDGPPVTVLDVDATAPAPSYGGGNGPGPPPTFSDPIGGGGGAAPSPTTAPAAPADTPAPNASTAIVPTGTTMPAPAESSPGGVPAGSTGGSLQSAGAAGVAGSSTTNVPSPAPALASSAPAMASSAPDAVTANDTADASAAAPASIDEGAPPAALPITAALATLAILGTILVLARRRRRPAAETAPAGVAPSIEDEVTAALRRRTLRRSRRRLDEVDPIVASLGVNEKGTTAPTPPTEGRGPRVPPA
jgi:hypothetical protein